MMAPNAFLLTGDDVGVVEEVNAGIGEGWKELEDPCFEC